METVPKKYHDVKLAMEQRKVNRRDREIATMKRQLEAAVEGLKTIMDEDEAESHPCGPQEYGYLGRLALTTLAKIKQIGDGNDFQ